jgi:putative redox protein
MEIRVSQLDGVKFAVHARSHTIFCDQPAENRGTDTGMTPPELLLASLGSCAAFYAAEYLRTRNLAQSGVGVSVTAEKLLQPARLGNFCVQVSSPVALTPEQHEAMMRAVHHCLVHNTLQSPPDIRIEIGVAAPGLAVSGAR